LRLEPSKFSQPGYWSRNHVWIIAASASGLLILAVVAPTLVSLARTGDWGIASAPTEGPTDRATVGNDGNLLLHYPGVNVPATVSALEAPWDDDDEVVGVTVGGEARAYLLESMSRPARHVINDMIGKSPISITYCNRDRCVRAFTQEEKQGPLDISVGGIHQGERLLLMTKGQRYFQKTLEAFASGAVDTFPYKDVPFTVTTWKQWKEAHQNTLASIPPEHDPKPENPGNLFRSGG
jgi:hypothetical protein